MKLFKIMFQHGATKLMQPEATLQDLSRLVSEHGRIVAMSKVEAEPRLPRVFDLSQVVFDTE